MKNTIKRLLLYIPATLVILGLLIALQDLRQIANYKPPVFTGTFIEQVNTIRASHDLVPLTETKELERVALVKCEDMVQRQYFEHIDPDGQHIWRYMKDFNHAGENLATDYFTSYDVVIGWQNSPKHLENIVNPNYTQIGHYVCQDGNNFKVVQVFKG